MMLQNQKDQETSQIDLMLLKFIEHHQLFEFIEIYQVYLQDDSRFK